VFEKGRLKVWFDSDDLCHKTGLAVFIRHGRAFRATE